MKFLPGLSSLCLLTVALSLGACATPANRRALYFPARAQGPWIDYQKRLAANKPLSPPPRPSSNAPVTNGPAVQSGAGITIPGPASADGIAPPTSAPAPVAAQDVVAPTMPTTPDTAPPTPVTPTDATSTATQPGDTAAPPTTAPGIPPTQ